jgi:hypothetical protein
MVGEDGKGWREKKFRCAKGQTHDKVCVCCAPRKNRTANSFFAERFFVVRLRKTARKAPLCRVPEKMCTTNIQTHNKFGVSRSENAVPKCYAKYDHPCNRT